MPWGFAYAPRGPVAGDWSADGLGAFTEHVRRDLPRLAGRVATLRIDPEIEIDGPLDPDGATRRALAAAGWQPATAVQPAATRIIDLRPDEATLLGDLRKKWRQYVNKARSAGIVVVDAEGDRLDDFYRIYRDTADRAGFLIRTQAAYRDVWEAFRPDGNARLLFAQTAEGEPLATLFLIRCGPRVVEPRPAASRTSRRASGAARSPMSGRGTSSWTGSGGPPTTRGSAAACGSPGDAAGSRRAGAPPPTPRRTDDRGPRGNGS